MTKPSRILWYFADPMCSWCWGFAPVISAIKEAYADRLKGALVLCGLRPGTTEPMTAALREEILHHWHEVHRRTGQPFIFDDAMPAGFVYDTEPPSRAVVAVARERRGTRLSRKRSTSAVVISSSRRSPRTGSTALMIVRSLFHPRLCACAQGR